MRTHQKQQDSKTKSNTDFEKNAFYGLGCLVCFFVWNFVNWSLRFVEFKFAFQIIKFAFSEFKFASKGWRSGDSARLPPMCPGFDYWTRHHMCLLLILFLALRGFSPGTPVFPSPQKPTFPNSNSIWNCQAVYHEPLARVIAQALPVFDIKFEFTL